MSSFLTIAEAAEYLNVSPRFLRRLVEERRIEFVKLGHHVRVERAALDRFVMSGTVKVQRAS